jgi:hypothetical protein
MATASPPSSTISTRSPARIDAGFSLPTGNIREKIEAVPKKVRIIMYIDQNSFSWQGKNFPANAPAGKRQGKRPAAFKPVRRILGDLVLMMAKTRVLTIPAIYHACIRAL